MSRVGFLGLGLMGQRMAGRVLRSGHALTVWDLDRGRASSLVAEGARLAPDPAAAVAAAEFVITMLADPEALEQVLFRPRGAALRLPAGATLLEMSTVGPRAVADVRRRLAPGVRLVDAPVLGSLPEAEDGRLTILVGASPSNFDRVAPLLSVMGRPLRVGGAGSGAALKLGVNLSLGGAITALGEALALATALGVDRDVALEVIGSSPWGGLLRNRQEMIRSGNFPPMLRLALAVKDLSLIAAAGASAGVRVPVAQAALAWLERAEAAFGGDVDFAAVVAEIAGKSEAGEASGD